MMINRACRIGRSPVLREGEACGASLFGCNDSPISVRLQRPPTCCGTAILRWAVRTACEQGGGPPRATSSAPAAMKEHA
jgi:hypothetical protein